MDVIIFLAILIGIGLYITKGFDSIKDRVFIIIAFAIGVIIMLIINNRLEIFIRPPR